MRKIIIVGGGLWGGLLAWYLNKRRPELDFVLYEAKDRLGGNHTWSFHESDVPEEELQHLKPFIRRSWPCYDVSFPSFRKRIDIPYHSISSDLFHQILTNTLPAQKIRMNENLSLLEAKTMADIVFDCRGINPVNNCGYQKFLGIEFSTKAPHGISNPILMEATVHQIDGFRFIYILPFDEQTLLVEDTRYSDNSFIDHFRIKENLREFIQFKGWDIGQVVREEFGALPIPFEHEIRPQEEGIIDLKEIFHDTTGYSLPDAVRLIRLISKSEMRVETLQKVVSTYREKRVKDRRFFSFLNRMMFQGNSPDNRYRTLQFFYAGNPGGIKKFYSGQMTDWDRLKFFIGRPPVKITEAMKVIVDGRSLTKERFL